MSHTMSFKREIIATDELSEATKDKVKSKEKKEKIFIVGKQNIKTKKPKK